MQTLTLPAEGWRKFKSLVWPCRAATQSTTPNPDRFKAIDPAKSKVLPRWTWDEDEIIASFGAANLIRHHDGRWELRGGTLRDHAAAREWCSLFQQEATFSSAPLPATTPQAKGSNRLHNRIRVVDHDSLVHSSSESLRLILGVGRSGTTWVSQVLSRARKPMRFYSEPLFHIEPPLPFQRKGDHTAVGYEEFTEEHPLLSAYRLLLDRQCSGMRPDVLRRDDAGWELCLVKEVHALLGTEGLLRHCQSPALFILRDPLYVADSLFSAQTLGTAYLDHEVKAVQARSFLDRFLPGRQEMLERLLRNIRKRGRRERIVLSKVVCIQLLQEMFMVLAREFPFVRLMCYEVLCEAPRESLGAAAQALSIPWNQDMEVYLAKTMQADSTSVDPYSVMRNTAEQKTRSFRFLTSKEIALCRSTLDAFTA